MKCSAIIFNLCLATCTLFAADSVWMGNVNGVWDTSTPNWTRNGTPSQVFQNGDTATFDDSSITKTVTGSVTNVPASVLVSNTTSYVVSAPIGGSGVLTKSGSGLLKLAGTNSFGGGVTLDEGTVWATYDSNLGAPGTTITFGESGRLSYGDNSSGGFTVDLGSRPIVVNSGRDVGLYFNGANKTLTTTGNITGDGGLVWGRDTVVSYSGGSGYENLNLLGTGNTFTGPITIGLGTENASGGGGRFNVRSLADSTNAITLNMPSPTYFKYDAGAVADLNLIQRPLRLINSSVYLQNDSTSYSMNFGGPVSAYTTGTKTLYLAGSGGGSYVGNISDGAGVLNLSKYSTATWTLSGTNTYTGTTFIYRNSGTTVFEGREALPPTTKVIMERTTTVSLRMDDSGTVVLGNEWEFSAIDTSVGITTTWWIDGRNNEGGTTGTVISLALLDFAGNPGNTASGRKIVTTGENGYRFQFVDVDMSHQVRGTQTGGPHRFEPSSASVTISGTIKQVNGNAAASTTDNNLYFGGTALGNVVSGVIADADDYPSNTNATPLNVYKGEANDWTFSGTNTYIGTTTVNGGVLRITGSISTGAVAVSSGVIGGTGSIGGSVTLSGSGGVDLRDNQVGTLTIGSGLDITGAIGANSLAFDLGAGGNGTDKIMVTGNVTTTNAGAAVITLNQLSGTRINAGVYDLIDASGSMPVASAFTLDTVAAFGNTFALQVIGSKLQVVVTAPPPAPSVAYWKGGGVDNNWSTLDNWSTDASGLTPLGAVPGYETDLSFYANGASRLTSGVLDADFDVNSLTYTASAVNNTTVGGAPNHLILESAFGITLNTPATNNPKHTISADVSIAGDQVWTIGSNGTLEITGSIDDFGANYGITKTGQGLLTLKGASTFTGGVTIEEGVLEAYTVNNTLESLGAPVPDPSNIMLKNGTTLRISVTGDSDDYMTAGFSIYGTNNGASATIEINASSVGSKGIGFLNTSSPGYGFPNQTRTIILTGNGAPTGGNYNRNSSNKLMANIGDNGSGAVSLVKYGSGYWLLGGSCTYSGGTIIHEGYLRIAKHNALPMGGAVTFADVVGTRLVFDNYSQMLGSISGGGANGGNIEMGSGTLTVGDASSTTFAGQISGSGGSLIKQGSGTLTLAASNTYSGTTTVNAGTLQLAADGALGTGNVVMGGGTLDVGSTVNIAGALDVNTDSTIILGNGTLSFANSSGMAWSGQLTLSGTLRSNTLRVGTDASGLTPAQIDVINHDGASVEISDEGYLVSNKATILIVR